jgi:hypothetical protein
VPVAPPPPGRPAGPVDRVNRPFAQFLARSRALGVLAGRVAVQLFQLFVYWTALAAIGLAAWVHRQLVIGYRRAVASLVAAAWSQVSRRRAARAPA